eukprot:scaffold310098_cov39-Tisochrysis_lutea.AAC.1
MAADARMMLSPSFSVALLGNRVLFATHANTELPLFATHVAMVLLEGARSPMHGRYVAWSTWMICAWPRTLDGDVNVDHVSIVCRAPCP